MVIKHSFVYKRNTNDLEFGVEVKLVIYFLVHLDLICPALNVGIKQLLRVGLFWNKNPWTGFGISSYD